MKVIPCRICNSRDAHFLFSLNNYGVVKCANCALVQLDANLIRSEVDELYSHAYFFGKSAYRDYTIERPFMFQNARNRLRRIADHLGLEGRSGARLLDVGCAAGFFLEVAQSEGWQVSGVEVSRYATEYAKNVVGVDVILGTLEEAHLPSINYDLITMWDMVEHLDNPRLTLHEAYRLLKPSGGLVLSTGDVNSLCARVMRRHWHLWAAPWHLSYFSVPTITTLLHAVGFRVVAIEHIGSSYSVGYLLARLSSQYRLPLLGKLQYLAQRLGLTSLSLTINLGDIMYVFARKSDFVR